MATAPAIRPSSLIIAHPLRFIGVVLSRFRANQGLLLAGAVAHYTLLSLIPLLILLLIALSRVIDEARLLATLSEYLEFVSLASRPQSSTRFLAFLPIARRWRRAADIDAPVRALFY